MHYAKVIDGAGVVHGVGAGETQLDADWAAIEACKATRGNLHGTFMYETNDFEYQIEAERLGIKETTESNTN